MNMKQIEYVIAIAECGSFRKAAAELGISQPSLSQYVKKIESQIGFEIFVRTGYNIRLTDAGRIYIENGRKILAIEHEMETCFADLSENKTGTLVVGTSPFRSASIMPAAAAEFKKRYPGVTLIIKEATTNELTEATLRGEYDICVITMPVEEEYFDVKAVFSEEILLAVPAGSDVGETEDIPGKKYPAVSSANLADKEFVMLSENQIMQRALNYLCDRENITVRKSAVCYSIEAQINMVAAGMGFAFVPSGSESLVSSGVNFYSLVYDLPKRKCAVITQKDKKITKMCSELVDIIVNMKDRL